ncbi:MAG: hypothetical protein CVU24_04985 [Betaproteobacteria bacterium HGW-Betaproteobacteria-18]|nr:MAG: hypothetical protein CVU24_04985 [Betaproteobacteria bacterium HGW-Betaproteobacteria-18]
MQVAATYDNGIIRFTQPIQFKHRQFKLMIDLPESEIDTTTAPAASCSSAPTAQAAATAGNAYLAQIQAILGPQFHPRAKTSVEQDKATYVDALEEKYTR